MRERIYIGIDPGQHGGMVAIAQCAEKQTIFTAPLCSMDRYSVRNWLQHKVSLVGPENSYALIEQLTGFISGVGADGNKRNIAAAHTMFILGKSAGWLEMALVYARVTFVEIPAREWERQYDIKPKQPDETPRKYKNRLKQYAKLVFPKERITLDTCDAYLLAHLCQKRNE